MKVQSNLDLLISHHIFLKKKSKIKYMLSILLSIYFF